MTDVPTIVRLGQRLPLFELTTYDPTKDEFGKFSMAQQMETRRWTVLLG